MCPQQRKVSVFECSGNVLSGVHPNSWKGKHRQSVLMRTARENNHTQDLGVLVVGKVTELAVGYGARPQILSRVRKDFYGYHILTSVLIQDISYTTIER